MDADSLRDRIVGVLVDTIRDDPGMGWSNVDDQDFSLREYGYRLIGVDGGINVDALAQAVIDDLGLTVERQHSLVAGLRDRNGVLVTEGMATRVVGKWNPADADPAPNVYQVNPDIRVPRLKACVEEWPNCEEGEYHPLCCRFPKSCSCTVYDPEQVSPEDLEDLP